MNILVIAPHPDDDLLGCGGTMAKKAQQGHNVTVCIAIKGSEQFYTKKQLEDGKREEMMAHILLGVRNTVFLDMPSFIDKTYPLNELTIKLAEIIRRYRPDEVYIPFHGDIHIDHCNVSAAAMVALRPKQDMFVRRIYEYETVSETGWNYPNPQNTFAPNVYEDIMETISKKERAIELFKSQIEDFPGARSRMSATSLAIHRGTSVSKPVAEAFMLVREVK